MALGDRGQLGQDKVLRAEIRRLGISLYRV